MDVTDALKILLTDRATDPGVAELIAAAREAMERRRTNSRAGGAVLKALHDDHGLSYREIERLTGISKSAAQRWAEPPPG